MGRLLVLIGMRTTLRNKWPPEVACEATGSLQDKRAFSEKLVGPGWEDRKQWQRGRIEGAKLRMCMIYLLFVVEIAQYTRC